MVTLATLDDLQEIDDLAVNVINDMATSNIPQWTLKYPRKEHYVKDIDRQGLYIIKNHGKIVGVITILPENDPPYRTITGWLTDKSIVIHRVLTHPAFRKQGIAQQLFDFAVVLGKQQGYLSIKIDTHLQNYKMRRFLDKNGYHEIGYLKCIDRQAYEKVLEEL